MALTSADATRHRLPEQVEAQGPGDRDNSPPAMTFWAFSLDFYDRPSVAAACLALQDEHGADVAMLLFALWCAARSHALTDAELAAVDAAIATWRESIVRPLRSARRALRPPPAAVGAQAAEALRRQLLAAEMEAERMQYCVMEALAPPLGITDPSRAARHNLSRLAQLCGFLPDPAYFAILLQAQSDTTSPEPLIP